MRIVIDHSLCEGNAVCEALAPDIFEVGNDFQARLLTEEPDETRRKVVEQAVSGCPRLAITVTD
jgi:ferredoxin